MVSKSEPVNSEPVGCKILVVEDEDRLQKAIKFKLKSKGNVVEVADSVRTAIDQLKAHGKFDAVWMDHYLVGYYDGIDLYETMSRVEEWADIPVFVVTNTASEVKLGAYKDMGAKKCFIKAEAKIDEIVDEIHGELTCDIEV